MRIEDNLLILCFMLACLSVVCTYSASEEDVVAIKSAIGELKADVNTRMNDVNEELQQLKRQMDTVIRKLVSSSPIAISSRSVNSTPIPRDCADVMSHGEKTSGVYTVYVGATRRPVQVYCDMTTDGGGWTVFQRRQDGSVNFYHNWADYEKGFGHVNGEHWLGNDILHRLTFGKTYLLRVDLGDWNGNTRYAEYSNFKVGSACEKYKLVSVGAYCGNAGDSLTYHSGHKFTTFDQDNDPYAPYNCATVYKGGWWFNQCHASGLNGIYLKGPHNSWGDGVDWGTWTGHQYSLKFAEMKIRPVDM